MVETLLTFAAYGLVYFFVLWLGFILLAAFVYLATDGFSRWRNLIGIPFCAVVALLGFAAVGYVGKLIGL